MAARQESLIPYRVRTVRIGVTATWIVAAALAAFALLPGRPEVELLPFLVTLGVAVAGATGIGLLPWKRLFETGRGMRVMYAWSIADVILIGVLLLSAGDAAGELFFLYAFTVVFAAASYPRRGQLSLLAFTVATYVGVEILRGWSLGVGDLTLRLGLLAGLQYMADFLSNELRREMEGRQEAQRESERRASLLATVAEAGRRMSDLDGDRVLQSVVDCALSLGFDAGNLAMYDDELESYAVVHARGLPREFVDSIHRTDAGMPTMVRDERRTVVVNDYQNHPKAASTLREHGVRAAIASPIWVKGRLSAALIASTKEQRDVSPEEVEAFELLASIAGRAMENAQRFEEERRAVERLADLDRLKGEFVATVSHELRTPLTTIVGMGATLEQHWDRLDESMRREFVQRLNASAASLDEIVRTLLDFSRLDAGGMKVHLRVVRIDQVVRSVVVRIGSLLERHRLRLNLEEAEVAGDPHLLERVVESLVGNAAKHTPEGTAVRVTTRVEPDEVVVEVTDSGPGIAPHDLPHLGDRFFRGDEAKTRAARGAGLGLSLVKELLELHGSTLETRSELGRGSVFSFRLPLWRQSSSAATDRVADAARRPA